MSEQQSILQSVVSTIRRLIISLIPRSYGGLVPYVNDALSRDIASPEDDGSE